GSPGRLWTRRAGRRWTHSDGRRGLSARLHPIARQVPRGRLPADHAEFFRDRERGPDRRAYRLHQIPDRKRSRARGSIEMTDAALPFVPPLRSDRESYLEEGHTLTSWLTTTDHKRIAILY